MASGNLKRKNQQASSAAESRKKAKASATTSGKGKAWAVSPPPSPDVQHFAITELKTLNQVVEHFALHHRRTDPPRYIPDEINPYIWPITDTRVERWLLDKLGPGMIHELDLAVEKGSAISEFNFKCQSCVYSDSEASSRPVVDLILLAAISIVNATSTIYREQLKIHLRKERQVELKRSRTGNTYSKRASNS